MNNLNFLYLSEPDLIKAGILDMKLCIDNAEETFRLLEKGDYLMGGPSGQEHGQRIVFPKEQRFPGMPTAGPDRRFMAMLAYIGGRFRITGVKWYGSNRENTKKRLPRINPLVILNDTETGIPLCIMVGNMINAMRSAAAPGVGIRHLTEGNAETAGLIGAGVLNRAAVMALKSTLPKLREVKVYDIMPDKCDTFCKIMSKELELDIHQVNSLKDAVQGLDIIHIGATAKPHIQKKWLKENALLLVSSDVELDDELLLKANLVMDQKRTHQIWYSNDRGMSLPTFEVIRLIEEGKLSVQDVRDLGSIVEGKVQHPVNNGEVTIFYWMGMPVFDIALGFDIYQNALSRGIGKILPLWDTPLWI